MEWVDGLSCTVAIVVMLGLVLLFAMIEKLVYRMRDAIDAMTSMNNYLLHRIKELENTIGN